jgi:hypothetical protein
VGRYLTGRSVSESRLGLLFNGLFKIPMQFGILFLGVMVFVFSLFTPGPLFYDPVEVAKLERGAHAAEWRRLEERHAAAAVARRAAATDLVAARHEHDAEAERVARARLDSTQEEVRALRGEATAVIRAADPAGPTGDTNYVFIDFVLHHLPAGVIGLVLAAIFAASMNSTSSELNALASTTVVDVYKRLHHGDSARHEVLVSRIATVTWTAFAVGFAEFASHLGSLIEAVNILGSLFYGTILGIFLVAFLLPRVGGTAVFIGAIAGEGAVLACFRATRISFLWYNLVGCAVVMLVAWAWGAWWPPREAATG